MPKIWYYGVFSLFHRCRASARLPSQKQKSIRTLCIFGAEQFKTRRFLFEQGTKSPPYCRMVRFLTQFRRKYAVLNHIGSPHLKVRGAEHNMPKIWYYGVFSLFHRCRASARLPSQKQKSIRTLCIFGAEQFKTSRFLFEQGTKSPPYCRMARFLTQVRRKYAVLNHIGFDSPHLRETPI